jgi:DNA repair protein RecO (recombination protein O)
MALKESEAIVLRTYPLRESDLLVTLFTRLEGKVKGVARAAKKSKRRFGGALEPMTYVRAVYDERERQELVRLDSCEVIESPMAGEVTFARATALAHVAELLDQLMPDREASDAVFRLTLAVLAVLRAVDDAADGLFAGVCGVRGLRTGFGWDAGLLARAGGWAGLRG